MSAPLKPGMVALLGGDDAMPIVESRTCGRVRCACPMEETNGRTTD